MSMENRTVGECFHQIRNGANIKQGLANGGFPITRIETTANDTFNRDRMGYAGITDIGRYEGFILEDGDLLMSHINSVQYLGRTVLYKKQPGEVIIHGMNLLGLKANRNIILPEYARYCFYAPGFREQLAMITKKSVNQASFTVSDLKKIVIKVPSLNEQRRTVVILDKTKELLGYRRDELQKLDELIKARFVEMFGDISEYCNVGYYIKALVAGKSLAGVEVCENKVLKTGAASFDYFDATQVKNLPLDYVPQQEHLVKAGDIIISRMNTAELTGAAAYVWDVPDKVYLPDRLWKAVLQDDCNPIFVWQMLIQPSTKEQIRRECSGTSGSMKNISKPGMLAIKVKKVPIAMQDQFADFVVQVDKSKVVIQKALDEAQILFDSLMQQYFG